MKFSNLLLSGKKYITSGDVIYSVTQLIKTVELVYNSCAAKKIYQNSSMTEKITFLQILENCTHFLKNTLLIYFVFFYHKLLSRFLS